MPLETARERTTKCLSGQAMRIDPKNALLHQLCFGAAWRCPLRIAIVAAHPDDEVIGAGAHLPLWTGAHIIYITDGAPRNLKDAKANGFHTREAYAEARKQEALAAMNLCGIAPSQLHWLERVDQGTSFELAALTSSLSELFTQLQPDVIITHAYEGGHPDHDSAAFAVHHACELLREQAGLSPHVFEFTSYHLRAGIMVTGEFLPCAETQIITVPLSERERNFKTQLFNCFRTQQRTLAGFAVTHERFRASPGYDFTTPPQSGALHYETFDWGMAGAAWRDLATAAEKRLQRTAPRTGDEVSVFETTSACR
jgi:LmbE family N-acetylglucosaminyl deacetylase